MGIQSGEIPIPDHVVKEVEKQLMPDEEIYAVLQPNRLRIMFASGFVFFGLVLCGFLVAIFSFVERGITAGAILPSLLPILGNLLFLISLINGLPRYIYAVTNRRIILITPVLSSVTVKSYGRRDITQLRMSERQNGYGDLFFARDGRGRNLRDVGFLGIPNVSAVRQLIIEIFEFEQDDFWD